MIEDPQVTIRKIDMAWELTKATVGQRRGLAEWAYIGAMLRVFKSAYVRVSDSFSELDIPSNVYPQDGHGPVHALQRLIGGDGADFHMEAARFLEELGKQCTAAAASLAIETRRGSHERPSPQDGKEQHHA